MALKRLAIADQSYGRTCVGYPFLMPENSCCEAYNVDWDIATLARKRSGASTVDVTTGWGPTGGIRSLVKFAPNGTADTSEIWAVDLSTPPAVRHIAAGTGWVAATLADAIADNATEVRGAALNGKLFLCYDSAVNRLHVWDGSTVRRVGLATPAAPTVADTGGGAYAATIRYYKTAYTVQVAGVTVRRSELSPVVSFTPSGFGTAARVTKPAAINEGETHWETYASPDNITYSLIATTVVATTTYDDSAAPASYTGNQPPIVGINTVPTSWKYVVAHGNRLVGAGAWESGGLSSRVWFTPVLGASDIGDDERVPNTTELKYWIDVGENDGGAVTGLALLNGDVIVFKTNSIWKLVLTSDALAPYQPIQISATVGAVRQQAIVSASDEHGNPALYFIHTTAPYRLGANGLERMLDDIEDIWPSLLRISTVVVGAPCTQRHQVWWWVYKYPGSGIPNYLTNLRLSFDTTRGRSTLGGVRGGWAFHTGASVNSVVCAGSFPQIGVTGAATVEYPFAGGTAGLFMCDTGTRDGSTAFQGYTVSRPFTPAGLGHNATVGDPHLHAQASADTTIQVSVIRDFGAETLTATTSIAAAGTETRVQRRLEDLGMHDAGVIQMQIGDASAVDKGWTLDAMVFPYEVLEPR